MNPHQFLLILRARFALIAGILVVTVATATAVSLMLPKQYVATSAVVVDVKSPDPVQGVYLPALAMPSYMATQIDLINSARVAQKVVKLVKLDQNEKAKEGWQKATQGKGDFEAWLVSGMQRGLEVKPSRDSNVINIGYKAGDASTAAAYANAYARAYVETTIDLKVEPAREYAKWFETQGKVLRDNLERAQNRLAEYQQQKGIFANDERTDYETSRLNELSAQLAAVMGQSADANSKVRAGGDGGALPDISQNSLIISLKMDISRLEGKLREASQNLGANHPQYQRMESELASLKARLTTETQHLTSGYATSRAVARSKEAELRATMEAQKKRLLDMKRDRGELGVLLRDVEAAQKAYDAVSQRFNQATLESQTTQANVALLTSASEPLGPSSPKTMLNIVASVLLGSLLGIAMAFVLEFLDRRVRSVDDLSDLLELPALGVIPNADNTVQPPLLPWFRKALPR